MTASIVITTKNRKDELRRALISARNQTGVSEILVVDDGSTDGTYEMVAHEFPSVWILRSEQSHGLIVQRTRAAKLVTSPIIFSIDDDATFSSGTIVETTLKEFEHPLVGAVAIPFVDVNRSPTVRQLAPHPSRVYAAGSYIGTAHAIRRDLFLTLSGYREILVHQGEEEDYCIRLLDAGYITRLGNADPIHHFESPRRSWIRMDYYGARNKILYAWQNVPFPYLSGHLAITTVKTLFHSLEPSRFWTRLRGVAAGYRLCFSGRTGRNPVSRLTYRISRDLKRRTAVLIEEIEARLGEHWPDTKAHVLRSKNLADA